MSVSDRYHCKSCKWYRRTHGDRDAGECHRFPPTNPIINGYTSHNPIRDGEQWPRVYAHDWCGEWSSK